MLLPDPAERTERLELSRWFRARRFPIGRRHPGRPSARSEEVAGARRWCSRGSCSLRVRPPAASSVESTRRRPRGRSRLRSTCGRPRGRRSRGRSPSPRRGRLARVPAPPTRSSRTAGAERPRRHDRGQQTRSATRLAATTRLGPRRGDPGSRREEIEGDRLPRPRDELPRRVCSPLHHVPLHDRQLRRSRAPFDRRADVSRDPGLHLSLVG